MRLRQLSYLEASVRLGSFRKAAEELNIAQPSLSDQIRRLEEELGVVLLVRGRTGVTVTDAGSTLLPHIEAMLRLERTIHQQAAAVSELQTGRVRVGMVPSASAVSYTAAVRKFRVSHPGIDVIAREMGSEAIVRSVLDGVLEIGLILHTFETEIDSRLRLQDLVPGSLALCVPTDHRLAEHATIDIAELRGQSMVVHQEGFALRRVFDRLRSEYALTVAGATESHFMIQRLVSEGVGLAFAFEPRGGTPLEGSVRQIPITEDWARGALAVVQRSDELPSPSANAFIRVLRTETAPTTQLR